MRWTFLALLLAGCAPARPANDQQACASQANDDPKVKALVERALGNPSFQFTGSEELAAAKQDATVACLRARGVVRGGGVERQRP